MTAIFFLIRPDGEPIKLWLSGSGQVGRGAARASDGLIGAEIAAALE